MFNAPRAFSYEPFGLVTLLDTLPHMLVLASATPRSAAIIAMTISVTISPYSTAVAPR